MALHIRSARLPKPEREYRFHPVRKFRFDFAWPDFKTALEVEGGTFTNGRHTRPKGYESDCHKYNLATLEGWKVFRVTTDMVNKGEALNLLEQAFAQGNL